MKSSWEETQQQSQYHFDPRRQDLRSEVIQELDSFAVTPEWHSAVAEIIQQARPATWRTRGYKGQGLDIPPADLAAEEYDLTSHGYAADHVISHLTWHVPEIFQKIADSYELEDVMIRMHVQHPGETWNRHIDKLGKWSPEDPGRVRRIFVQLTDWQPGQFWEFGNYHWQQWRAGEAITFDWANMPHSTANAGHHPRVTMQITGRSR